MRHIYIMSGLPGSGKSTYVHRMANAGDLICHRDVFRQHLRNIYNTTDYFPCEAKEEYRRWAEYLRDTIGNNPDANVWIDQTTLTKAALAKLLAAIMPAVTTNDFVEVIAIHTSLKICLERNAQREGHERVPDKVIEDMSASMFRDPIQLWAMQKEYPNYYFGVYHTNEMEVPFNDLL